MACVGTGSRKGILKGQGGFLAVDFIFAIILTVGVMVIMMALSLTLSVIEISQYVAFSTARIHSAGHDTVQKQRELATAKFKSYQSSSLFPQISIFLRNGWFLVEDSSLDIRSGTGAGVGRPHFDSEYGREREALPQVGIRFTLEAKILALNLPFVGSTARDEGYKTFVTGMMIREPTADECRRQVKARFDLIKNLGGGRFPTAMSTVGGGSADNAYMPLEDNGC